MPSKNDRTRYTQIRVDELLKRAEQLQGDPRKPRRMKVLLCPLHFYSGEIFLSDIRQTVCLNPGCFNPILSSSEGGNSYCPDCCKEHGICRRCGADLDLKIHRT
jgi:hypothetical protein